MKQKRRGLTTLSILVAGTLAIAACGSDGDESTPTGSDKATESVTTDAVTDGTDAGTDADAVADGEIAIAEGVTVDTTECPSTWDNTGGITDDEIRIGTSGPQSGALAVGSQNIDSLRWYFDYVNETNPIDGKKLVLVDRDDAYEAGRAVANVREMLETENVFGFFAIVGTPIVAALEPIADEECVPLLLNGTGFPAFSDPANHPWTSIALLSYSTEPLIWCSAIVDEFGEGATVAALYANNDFGKAYQEGINDCVEAGQVDVVEEILHDPAAPDVSNEVTTLLASKADALLLGTSAAFCPQPLEPIAASDWRPLIFASSTCTALPIWTPFAEAAGELADGGYGVRIVTSSKPCGDPAYADDPAVQQMQQILDEYGDVQCEDGQYQNGLLNGMFTEYVLRSAAELPGGLTRTNVITAMWNADTSFDAMLGGTQRTDGVNDAFWVEAAQVQQLAVDGDELGFVSIGEVIDTEGQAGSFGG